MTTNDVEWVRIERTFDAPIARVWDLWTKPEMFAQWYAPKGMTVPFAEMDVVVGGRRKICMSMETPERSMQMWFTGEYREVNAPHRLVYTERMCDADGNTVPPKALGHPEVTEVIVQLEERGTKTAMTLIHIGVPADSGGAGGWKMAIEKMAALLDQASG